MDQGLDALRHDAVRGWFRDAFPAGPTAVQARAWAEIASRRHILISSPTGTGKTLAAFLGIVDRLLVEFARGELKAGLRCVYVSPLRSLGYDIERNLGVAVAALRGRLELDDAPIRVGVRTGDTSARERRRLRLKPPHILITTPESLSLLLAQPAWVRMFATIDHVIIDEIHELVANKRGADLTVSIERLSIHAERDPVRIGLSATCRPLRRAARFLGGEGREVAVIAPEGSGGAGPLYLTVESLMQAGEAPDRGLSYRRLLRRIRSEMRPDRTLVVFANTRPFTEKITHDLRLVEERADGDLSAGAGAVGTHHSALSAGLRRDVEAGLKAGRLRTVVTSTSLELGVDYGPVDQTLLVGLPASVTRCLQRVGRSGRQRGAARRGVLLAATPAELAGAAVMSKAARSGRIEPLNGPRAPLDIVCQQLLGMACAGIDDVETAFAILRRAAPFARLRRADFEDCLRFLAGELPTPAGAADAATPAGYAFTAPRLWRHRGAFGLKRASVRRWLYRNIGTITSDQAALVNLKGKAIGSLEAAYADRLQPGDRFVLNGRVLQVKARKGATLEVRVIAGEPNLPRWTSDRQSLSAGLSRRIAAFRDEAAQRLIEAGPEHLREWLREEYHLRAHDAALLVDLFHSQAVLSEIPSPRGVLVEHWPTAEGSALAFHAALGRAACEVMGRVVAARLGRLTSSGIELTTADLGWVVAMSGEVELESDEVARLFRREGFGADLEEALARGELLARRFRHVASTALMVLRNPDGPRTRVGGQDWVSERLYPLVKAACPDHPLLRETRREVLNDLFDVRTAYRWLERLGAVRLRSLPGASPFTVAWLDAQAAEPLAYASPEEALVRLHHRLFAEQAR